MGRKKNKWAFKNLFFCLYDKLHLIPEMGSNIPEAPNELDWYQKYLYGKIVYCKANKIDAYYDDDKAVSNLFKKYADEIKFILV